MARNHRLDAYLEAEAVRIVLSALSCLPPSAIERVLDYAASWAADAAEPDEAPAVREAA